MLDSQTAVFFVFYRTCTTQLRRLLNAQELVHVMIGVGSFMKVAAEWPHIQIKPRSRQLLCDKASPLITSACFLTSIGCKSC